MRALKYVGKKATTVAATPGTDSRKVNPGEVIDLHPLIARELLRLPDWEPVRLVEAE